MDGTSMMQQDDAADAPSQPPRSSGNPAAPLPLRSVVTSGTLPSHPDWLVARCKQARATHEESPDPQRRSAWRNTDLKPLWQASLTLADAAHVPIPTSQQLADARTAAGPVVVLVDGFVVESCSTLGAVEGARVGSLGRLLADEPDLLEPYLATLAPVDDPDHVFAAVNTSLVQDGAVILVPAGVELPEPIEVIQFSTPRPVLRVPRTLVVAETRASVSIVETFATLPDANPPGAASHTVAPGAATDVTNAVTEIVAGANAMVDHLSIANERVENFHLHSVHAHAARDAHVTTRVFAQSGGQARHGVYAVLEGEGSEVTMDGLFLGAGSERVDNHTAIEHRAPHTTSRQLYKGIVTDQARGAFTGYVLVAKGAQKTNAEQSNPNLILSDGARIDTTPQLEIYADDVKCAHGSTIGQLESDAVFYLRSRGFDEATARLMLTQAFAAEVIDRVPNEAIRGRLHDAFAAWFRSPGGDSS